MRGLRGIRILVVLILAAGLIPACGSKNSGAVPVPVSTTFAGTQSAGDLWTGTFDVVNNTFSLTNTNSSATSTNPYAGMTFSGTMAALPNGFLKLTVSTVTDPLSKGTVAVGNVGYAYVFPGVAVFVKPPPADPTNATVASQTSRAIFLANKSSSASWAVGDAFNWVVIPSTLWVSGLAGTDTSGAPCSTSSMSNATGHGQVTAISGPNVTIVINEFAINGTPDAGNPQTQVMTDLGSGQMSGDNPGNPSGVPPVASTHFTFQVTTSGAFMGDVTETTPSPPGPQGLSTAGFFGMKAPASAIDTNDIYNVTRHFRVVIFREKVDIASGVPLTDMGWARSDPSFGGDIDGGGFTNDETDVEPTSGLPFTLATLPAGSVIINLGTQSSPGVFVGTITDQSTKLTGGQATNFMVNKIGGKYFIFGIAAHKCDQPFNFMMIEQ